MKYMMSMNCHSSFNRPGNDEIDPQFRLWLSSKPDPSFPISILQTGMKVRTIPDRRITHLAC